MNMQAMLKQAQTMQKQMMNTQEEINKMKFIGKSSLVTIEMLGDRTVNSCCIKSEMLEKDDIEMVQDMIVLATNDALSQINKITEEKMGVYTKGIPGLF